MNENFDTFKQNVANIVKRIVLDQIESHCLSIEQCHQLCEAGFPYFTNNMFLSPTALIVYHCNHGNITRLMDNTKYTITLTNTIWVCTKKLIKI